MTINIDASRADKKEKTGVERYAYKVINGIINSNNISRDIKFVLYTRGEPSRWLKEMGERSNVEVKRLWWPFKYFWTQGRLSLEMLLYKIHGIASSPPPPAGGGGSLAMTKNKLDALFIPASAMPIIYPKNTVAVIHDVGFMRFPEAYGGWQRAYLRWSTKFAVKHAKKIITISQFSKSEIIKYFNCDKDKIDVVPLACDSEKFKIIKDKNKIKKVLDKYSISKPYILFVGRLEKKKNIKNIIKAFLEFKASSASASYKLVLSGSPGLADARPRMTGEKNDARPRMTGEKIQDDIIMPGFVPDEDLPYLYSGAEIFLFPSLYEGFGMPILEAMACGTPVITSNISSCPEVGGDAVAYVNPKNYKEIADMTQKLLSDNDFRQSIIKQGLDRAKKFSWQECGLKTITVLKNIKDGECDNGDNGY